MVEPEAELEPRAILEMIAAMELEEMLEVITVLKTGEVPEEEARIDAEAVLEIIISK